RVHDRHVGTIEALCRACAGEASDDMTAEVFARAWLNRSRYRDEANGSAAPWLFGIAGNLYRDWLRRNRVEAKARQRLGLPELRAGPEVEQGEGRLALPPDGLAAGARPGH